MKPLTQRIGGAVYVHDAGAEGRGAERRGALLLDETAGPVYLRYALVVRGTEAHVFPALLLDDWGKERKSPAVYDWIYEHGQRFPRAEVFGFDAGGAETQIFLRDLEIFFKWPCYAYEKKGAPIPAGTLLHTFLVPDPTHDGPPTPCDPPDAIAGPLRRAAVHWRRANPHTLAAHGFHAPTQIP